MVDGQRIAAAYAPRRLSEGGIAFDENALADAIEAYAAEERQDGRIAALREACERTCPHGTLLGETCGQVFTDGSGKRHTRARCTLHRLLAEAESGEQVREVGDDR